MPKALSMEGCFRKNLHHFFPSSVKSPWYISQVRDSDPDWSHSLPQVTQQINYLESMANTLILALTVSEVLFSDLHKGKLDSNKHNNLSWSENQMYNFSHLSLLYLIAYIGSLFKTITTTTPPSQPVLGELMEWLTPSSVFLFLLGRVMRMEVG